jgi:hypothetical protein
MTTRIWTTWLLVAAACAGAALALRLVDVQQTWLVLVAVVVAVLLATVMVQPEKRPEKQPEVQPNAVPKAVSSPEPLRPAPGSPAPTARLVLDVEKPAGGQWWTQTQTSAPPRPTSNGDAPRPVTQARDLAGYVESARVVQCPRCGSFHIDVTRLAGGYSFRCRTDEHAWQWQPGRAWPSTVVVSRRRTT